MNTEEIKTIHWMTVKDVASLFGSSESSIRRLIRKKLLRAYKPGGRDWLIKPEDCKERLKRSSNFLD